MATLLSERSTYWVRSGGANPNDDGDYRYYWQIYYEQSDTDKLNNQTQIIVDYYIQTYKSSSSMTDMYSYPSGTSSTYVDGSLLGSISTSGGNISVGTYWALKYIGQKRRTVRHDNNGTKKITWYGVGFGKGTSTDTYTLPTIQRNSILGTIPTFNVDDGVAVPLTKYVPSYYDRLVVNCKDTNSGSIQTIKTIDNFKSGQKVEFSESELDSIYTFQKLGASTQIIFELKTYSDSGYTTQVGSTSAKNVIANLTVIAPSMNGFNYLDVNPTTSKLTANTTTSNVMVKGMSTLRVSIPKEIESVAHTRKAVLSHYIIDGQTVDYNETGVVKDILNYTKDNIEVYAVDSRGTSSLGMTKVFKDNGGYIAYSPVTKNDDQSYTRQTGDTPDGIGPIVNLYFSGTWWKGNFGTDDNVLSATYKFKKTSEKEYKTGETALVLNVSDATNFSFDGQIKGDGADNGFDISETYDIIVTVSDSTGSVVQYTYSIHAGEPAIALYKNKASLGAAYDESLGGTQIWGDLYKDGLPFVIPKEIEEKSVTDDEIYIKYTDGTLFVAQSYEASVSDNWNTWGNAFVSTPIEMQDYPIPFVKLPMVVKWYSRGSYNGWLCDHESKDPSVTNPGAVQIIRPAQVGGLVDFRITVMAIGKWK